MAERRKVWECIGCGRIEGPQPCIGVCRDQKVEMVYASEHDAVLDRVRALEAVLAQIAWTTPRPGEFEPSWRALQERARKALA